MGIGMVADFMAGGRNAAGYRGQALHVLATHEESGRNMVTGEDLQKRRSRFTRPVVEGQSYGRAIPIPVIHRRSENAGGAAAHGISQQSPGGNHPSRAANQRPVRHENMIPPPTRHVKSCGTRSNLP